MSMKKSKHNIQQNTKCSMQTTLLRKAEPSTHFEHSRNVNRVTTMPQQCTSTINEIRKKYIYTNSYVAYMKYNKK